MSIHQWDQKLAEQTLADIRQLATPLSSNPTSPIKEIATTIFTNLEKLAMASNNPWNPEAKAKGILLANYLKDDVQKISQQRENALHNNLLIQSIETLEKMPTAPQIGSSVVYWPQWFSQKVEEAIWQSLEEDKKVINASFTSIGNPEEQQNLQKEIDRDFTLLS